MESGQGFIYNLLTATPGIVLVILIIVAVMAFFMPLFVWGIHNQTTRTADEMEKMNQKFDKLLSNVKKNPNASPQVKAKDDQARYEV